MVIVADVICYNCGLINDSVMVGAKNICNGCDGVVKINAPAIKHIIPFGKYKDVYVKQMNTPEQRQYLAWMYNNCDMLSKNFKESIHKHLHKKA